MIWRLTLLRNCNAYLSLLLPHGKIKLGLSILPWIVSKGPAITNHLLISAPDARVVLDYGLIRGDPTGYRWKKPGYWFHGVARFYWIRSQNIFGSTERQSGHRISDKQECRDTSLHGIRSARSPIQQRCGHVDPNWRYNQIRTHPCYYSSRHIASQVWRRIGHSPRSTI